MKSNTSNILVLFGATGDLARRYLLPAICTLHMADAFHVVLVGRRDWKDADVDNYLSSVEEEFSEHPFDHSLFSYVRIDLTQPGEYQRLSEHLHSLDIENSDIVYYLSVGPGFFIPVAQSLANHGLHTSPNGGTRRIVIEKPFGKDLKTATLLNLEIQKYFPESDIYRVDHYLGKNAVLELQDYRLVQGGDWGSKRVKKISVILNEELTVLSRGEFYDANGAIRDYVQNHLLQILAIAAMGEPHSHHPDDIRDRKMQFLQSISPLLVDPRHEICLGQYEGYRHEDGVSSDSRTETFIRVELHSDDPLWQGVTFVLQSGKALAKKETKIVIEFVDGTERVFEVTPKNKNNAYEALIREVFAGDQMMFVRWDSIKAAWHIVDDLIHCRDNCPMVYTYEVGSDGPVVNEKGKIKN